MNLLNIQPNVMISSIIFKQLIEKMIDQIEIVQSEEINSAIYNVKIIYFK